MSETNTDTQTAQTSTADGAESTMREALEDGQLDPEADGGHTPANEDSGDGVAGGHTPDSGPTDSDGSSQEDGESPEDGGDEQLPEDMAEEQLSDEEDDTTDEQDQDSDDSGEEEEEDGKFFEGEYSEYETEKEARHAIDKKDELIYKYRDELAQERKQRQQAESQVEQLRETLPEDKQKEMLVQSYVKDELGEEHQDILEMTEEELDSNPQKQRRLMKARARAETRLENEIEQAREQREKQKEKRDKRLNEAHDFVSEWVTPDEFRANTPEDRIELKEYFQDSPEGVDYNRAEMAVLLYSDYGQEAAQRYLEGIRHDFVGDKQREVEETVDESEPEPKEQPQPSSEDPATKEKETETQEFQSDNALDTMRAALMG